MNRTKTGLSIGGAGWLLVGLLATGCQPPGEAQPGPPPGQEGPVAVETAIAATGTLEDALEYTGTTQPVRQVMVRSQLPGQLQTLTVDVGDAVAAGDLIAQVDDAVLRVELNEAAADLTARRAEVAQAEAALSDVRTAQEQARVQLQQARTEAERQQRLAAAGAISIQDAEQAQVAAAVAEQALRSTQEQVRTRQQAVAAARAQVQAQGAVVAQQREQLADTRLPAPLGGVVLQRLVEPGDFVQTGGEVVQIGDLSVLEVTVQMSELDIAQVRVGQPVQVRLDAFPGEMFAGRVSRIAPVADVAARQLPVEITLENTARRIGSGLLARVQFGAEAAAPVVIPASALQQAETGPVVYVVPDEATAQVRPVQIGEEANGQVEVLSGLQAGESYVLRSDRPLADGEPVRLSILSQ